MNAVQIPNESTDGYDAFEEVEESVRNRQKEDEEIIQQGDMLTLYFRNLIRVLNSDAEPEKHERDDSSTVKALQFTGSCSRL